MPFTLLTDGEGKELPTSCLPTIRELSRFASI
jgi:hypothetical protein